MIRTIEYENGSLVELQMVLNNLQKRREALRLEELRIHESLEHNETARIEINYYINRVGQKIDKLV